MSAPHAVSGRIRFDDFEADLRTEELFRSGRKVRLPRQSFHVLAILLERAGQLVTREELYARVWPAGALVEYDQGLNAVVKRLREALHDSAEAPRFIETLPKRGYRFIAAVQPNESPSPPPTPEVSDAPPELRTSRPPRKVPLIAAAVLVAGGIALWLFQHSTTSPPSEWHVVPFTSLPGQEIAPTFSPDGSQIAFGWNGAADAGGQFDLYVKSLGSERLLRLTHRPAKRVTPSWSPDGRAIAFVREEDERTGIYLIPALGGAERRIVDAGIALGTFGQISWAPDGQSLAYSGYGPKGRPLVYIVALDALSTQPLSPAPECLDAAEPAFSPDGQQLAFICMSSAAVYSIYTVERLRGRLKSLASVMGYPLGLAWSPDGRRLIFANDAGEGGQLWQLTLKGELTKLPFGENSSGPAVAGDGRLAYVRGRSALNVWRADLTATHPEESAVRLIYSTLLQAVPRYSPDGARIAFQSNRSGSAEIWITDAEGADPERVTSFNGPLTNSPSWCSDGRRIAFDSRASGVSEIYVEDIGERVPRAVVTSQRNLSAPAWSGDCRWLFAHDGNGTLYRFPSSGGPAERVTDRPSSYSLVVADRLIFNVQEPDGVVIWSKPVSGGREEPVANVPKLRYEDAWTASASGIYYTDTSSRPINLNYYEFASQTTRTLMTLQQVPVPGSGPGIAVSLDGRWLLYSQVEDEQSEIMLAQNVSQRRKR
jgi:Tol biopolymer transport system component/DNA-binding winged helix-turn-helix (wHTH) protein